jgi:hypothetical protein
MHIYVHFVLIKKLSKAHLEVKKRGKYVELAFSDVLIYSTVYGMVIGELIFDLSSFI